MGRVIEAEVISESAYNRSRRASNISGLGQDSGAGYSYQMPSGQIVSISWPDGGPQNLQDNIVYWIEENPMLAIMLAFVAGLFARGRKL